MRRTYDSGPLARPQLTRRGFVSLAGAALVGMAGASVVGLTGCSSSGTSSAASVKAIRDRGHLNCGVKTDVIGYGYQDTATGKFQGMEIDICYAIAAKVFGVSMSEAKHRGLASFTGVTAKTRGPLVDSGQVDLVCATYTITPERKKSWNFSPAYYTDSIGMLVLKSSGIKSVADLDGRIVGVGEGGNWGFRESMVGAIHRMEEPLLGQNPPRIEYLDSELYSDPGAKKAWARGFPPSAQGCIICIAATLHAQYAESEMRDFNGVQDRT